MVRNFPWMGAGQAMFRKKTEGTGPIVPHRVLLVRGLRPGLLK